MKTFTFVSLNLWLGGLLFDNIIPFLRQQQPDILSLQEAYEGGPKDGPLRFRSLAALQEVLGLPHAVFAPAFSTTIDGVPLVSGNGIISRFPISEHEVTFFDVPFGVADTTKPETFSLIPRNLERAAIDCGDGAIAQIFNTQGIWGTDGEDNDRRLAMSRVIADKVRGRSNAILSGDFNVGIHTQSIRIIEGELTNVFKGKLTSTFNMRRKDNPKLASAVIDMIFVSRDIMIRSIDCPDIDVSDHRPQIMTFSFGGSTS